MAQESAVVFSETAARQLIEAARRLAAQPVNAPNAAPMPTAPQGAGWRVRWARTRGDQGGYPTDQATRTFPFVFVDRRFDPSVGTDDATEDDWTIPRVGLSAKGYIREGKLCLAVSDGVGWHLLADVAFDPDRDPPEDGPCPPISVELEVTKDLGDGSGSGQEGDQQGENADLGEFDSEVAHFRLVCRTGERVVEPRPDSSFKFLAHGIYRIAFDWHGELELLEQSEFSIEDLLTETRQFPTSTDNANQTEGTYPHAHTVDVVGRVQCDPIVAAFLRVGGGDQAGRNLAHAILHPSCERQIANPGEGDDLFYPGVSQFGGAGSIVIRARAGHHFYVRPSLDPQEFAETVYRLRIKYLTATVTRLSCTDCQGEDDRGSGSGSGSGSGGDPFEDGSGSGDPGDDDDSGDTDGSGSGSGDGSGGSGSGSGPEIDPSTGTPCCPGGLFNTLYVSWDDSTGGLAEGSPGNVALAWDPAICEGVGGWTWTGVPPGCDPESPNQTLTVCCVGSDASAFEWSSSGIGGGFPAGGGIDFGDCANPTSPVGIGDVDLNCIVLLDARIGAG